MTVWLEYAILQNFIIDLILLCLMQKSLRLKIIPYRSIISALFGTFFAIIYPLLSMPQFLLQVLKFLVGGVMVLFCMETKHAKYYLLGIILFYILTFAYGGAIFALFSVTELNFNADGYYSIAETPMGLMLALLPIFLLLAIYCFYRMYQKFRQTKLLYECSVGGEDRLLKGLLDTGNGLYYQGKPVCIIDKRTAGRMNIYGKIIGYVNVKTATGNGILSVFASSLKIYSDGTENIIDKVYFAISPITLEGDYELILHTALLTNTNE